MQNFLVIFPGIPHKIDLDPMRKAVGRALIIKIKTGARVKKRRLRRMVEYRPLR